MVELCRAARAKDVQGDAHQRLGAGLEMMRAHRLEDAGHSRHEVVAQVMLRSPNNADPTAAQYVNNSDRRVNVVDLLGRMRRHVQQLQRWITQPIGWKQLLARATVHVGQGRTLLHRGRSIFWRVAAYDRREVSALDRRWSALQKRGLEIVAEKVGGIAALDGNLVHSDVAREEVEVLGSGFDHGVRATPEIANAEWIGGVKLFDRRDGHRSRCFQI
ncbi:MAG TPA: hypothetical protein VH143_29150 [Kofleriaceae bacterium]|nr:hypothetical protein [Kofleriaceae bacterium]